MLMLAGYFTA